MTNSELATKNLRDVARFIDENAETIIGDIDSVLVTESIEVSFDVTKFPSTVSVTKEFIPTASGGMLYEPIAFDAEPIEFVDQDAYKDPSETARFF